MAQPTCEKDAFTPSAAKFARARAVIDLFAANPKAGTLSLDGKMLDKPHVTASNHGTIERDPDHRIRRHRTGPLVRHPPRRHGRGRRAHRPRRKQLAAFARCWQPLPPLNLVADFGGGTMLLAFGMVCGLLEAARSGRGQVVDTAMIDGASMLMAMIYGMQDLGRWTNQRGAPAIGADTDAALGEAGFALEEINDLRHNGVTA